MMTNIRRKTVVPYGVTRLKKIMITQSRQLTSPPPCMLVTNSDLVDVTKTLHLILFCFCYVHLYFYSFHFKAKETSALIGHAALLMFPSPLSAFPFGMHYRTSSQSRLSSLVFDNVASRRLLCLDLNHLGIGVRESSTMK